MQNPFRSVGFLLKQMVAVRWLTGDSRSFVRYSLDLVLYRVLHFIKLRETPRSIRLANGYRLKYRLNRGDIWAIYEIWMEDPYRLPRKPRAGTLVDLGTNIGLASLWLAKQYGFSRVVGVEPSPGNAAIATENLKQNGLDAVVICAAISGKDGKAVFREMSQSTHNHLRFDGMEYSGEPVAGVRLVREYDVPIMTMKTIERLQGLEAQPVFVKLDVEGAEQEMMTADDLSWTAAVEGFILEFHPPHANVQQLHDIFEKLGFEYIPPGEKSGCSMHCFFRPASNAMPAAMAGAEA